MTSPNILAEFLRRLSPAKPVPAPIPAELDTEMTPDGQPMFRAESTAMAPEPPQMNSLQAMFAPPQPTPSSISAQLNPAPPMNDLAYARQLGGAFVPPPSQTSPFPAAANLTAGGHPKLGSWLENFMVAQSGTSRNPTDPFAGQMALADFHRQRQAEQDSYEMNRLKTGLGLTKELDAMASGRTAAENAAQLNASAVAENYAQAARARREDMEKPLNVAAGGMVLVPDPTAPDGYRRIQNPSATSNDPNITSTTRPDTQSKTGFAEYRIGVDPTTGKVAWETRIGDAPKPSTGPAAPSMLGEMTAGQASSFNRIVDRYNASPAIRASDKTPVLEDSIAQLRANPKKAALQLPVIYNYIKALDMYDSAVREGEILLAREVESLLGKMERNVQSIQSGQILEDSAILEIAGAASNLVRTIRDTARDKAKSYESQANVLGLNNQWKQYIEGFRPSYDRSSPPASAGATSGGRPPLASFER